MLKFYLASIALLFVSAVRRPSSAQCPHGWWLDEGVRPSGEYTCRPIAPSHEVLNKRGGYIDIGEPEPGELHSRVYCNLGQRAATANGISVTCDEIPASYSASAHGDR